MRRAVLYARQSLDKTGEGLAVARQLEDCRALAARNGWQAVGEYVDNDVSATSGRVRPEYRRMLDAVQDGRADTIVSHAPDRLARRPRDLEDLLDLVEGRGVSLATVSGDVDLSTPYGRTIARIFGAIARQEVEQKGARQARANLQRAQDGRTSWTRRPFGYHHNEAGEVVVVEDEAAELRKGADGVLQGCTLASLVRDLTARGVTTTAGRPFTVTALRRALLNPRVSGQAIYRGQVVGQGAWTPILEPDAQARLGVVLRDPARRTQTSTNHRYLLSGLVRCGRCGEPMFASPMGVKGAYYLVYKCRRTHLSRRLDLVDNLVAGVLLKRLSQPDAAALLGGNSEDAERLRDRSLALRAQLDELADMLAEGVLTAVGVRKTSERLRAELEEVERERASLGNADAFSEVVNSEDVEATWTRMPLLAQRALIDRLLIATILPAGKGVPFSPGQVQVHWRAGA